MHRHHPRTIGRSCFATVGGIAHQRRYLDSRALESSAGSTEHVSCHGRNDEGFMSEAWLQGEGLAMACLFNFEGSAIRQGLFLLTSACKSKDEQSACCCVGSAMFCQGGGVQRRGNRDLVFRCLLQLFAKGSGCCG